MDRQRFDELARALAVGRLTRRGALRFLGFGALGSTGARELVDATAQAKGAGQVQEQADRGRKDRQGRRVDCGPSGRKCRIKASNAASPSSLCKNCCETFHKRSETTGRCCSANGQPCGSATECCLGACSAGICQDTAVQYPPPPVDIGDTNSGGPPPPGETPPPPPNTPGCVEYGKSCTQAADCCNGVPCSGSLCRYN